VFLSHWERFKTSFSSFRTIDGPFGAATVSQGLQLSEHTLDGVAHPTSPPRSGSGAYGLRLEGIEGLRHLLLPAPKHWPLLQLERRAPDGRPPGRSFVAEEWAEAHFGDNASIVMDRQAGSAIFTIPSEVPDEALVHPYLAPVAGVFARWHGREAFHGGGFVLDGMVWGLIGEKGCGKSSTVAWLATHGHQVVCDDALVVTTETAYAGPRCIDLRAEAARQLGIGELLPLYGPRERWRYIPGPVSPELPLGGWIFLAWGPQTEVVTMPGSETLRRLSAQRSVLVEPVDPARLLDWAAFPAFEFRRARRWGTMAGAMEHLLEEVSGRSSRRARPPAAGSR
jgi:hypothetical protein